MREATARGHGPTLALSSKWPYQEDNEDVAQGLGVRGVRGGKADPSGVDAEGVAEGVGDRLALLGHGAGQRARPRPQRRAQGRGKAGRGRTSSSAAA